MPPRPKPRPDEDDEEEYGMDDDDYIDADSPEQIFSGDATYNQAVAKGEYIRVKFIKPLVNAINASTLFPDTKETLILIVYGLFDKTQVLAKIQNAKLEEINVEIILAQARVGFHASDVDNHDLATVYNLIRQQYHMFISRAVNGWERELDNRIETSATTIHRQEFPGGNMPEKRYPWYHPKRYM